MLPAQIRGCRCRRLFHPLIGFLTFAFAAPAFSAETAVPANAPASAAYLKRLTLEELLAMDVTTVSRRSEQIADTASAITLLTGDDVRRSGALTLADALRFSTGLEVARIDGRTWGVAARGFNLNASNKLLVMLDGRSLYTPLFSGVFWDVQDTELADVERIEVVRGPGATMWGANAVNGVISIHTKPARETVGTLISGGAGNEEQHFASFRHGLKLTDGIYARFYAKEYHRDDLVVASGADAGDDAKMWQAGFRIDGEHANARATWTAQGDIYHGFLGASGAPDTRVAGGNLIARTEHKLDSERTLNLQAYYDRVERFVPGQFREWRDTLDFDLQFNAPLGSQQTLVTGLTARRSEDETSTRGTVRFVPPARSVTNVGGFLQDEIRFAPARVALTLGAKFEHNDSTGFEFQPSVRVSWRATSSQLVWGAVSRAVRTPSRFDDDLRFVLPTGLTFVRGQTDFRSENLAAYELGYRVHPNPHLAIDISLFENRYDNLRSQERSTEPDVLFILQNQLNARTRGGEISVAAEISPDWRLRFMCAQLHKRLTFDAGSTDVTGGAQEGNDPRTLWTLVSNWNLPRQWEIDLMVRRVSPLPSPYVPGYTELDAHLGWQPTPAWEFAIVGQNLLNDRHPEFGAAGPSRRELERSMYGKVTWRF